jgi:hypothetical protein
VAPEGGPSAASSKVFFTSFQKRLVKSSFIRSLPYQHGIADRPPQVVRY